MNEDQILKGRLSDLAKRAYNQNIYTYSNFLSPEQLSLFYETRQEYDFITATCYGGHEAAQRQMIGFGSEDEFGYEGTFPIKIVRAVPIMEKFSDNLTHRDYLGALMNLGIARDTIGDILIKDKCAYIICIDSMADYITKELSKVRHTLINCEIVDNDIPELKPTFEDVSFPVSSLRLDVILANLIKCSRSESIALFEEKKVTLNGRITGRNSIILKEGDVFSVRGHGKFIFQQAGKTTKKGKIYVHIKRYV